MILYIARWIQHNGVQSRPPFWIWTDLIVMRQKKTDSSTVTSINTAEKRLRMRKKQKMGNILNFNKPLALTVGGIVQYLDTFRGLLYERKLERKSVFLFK